MIPPAKRLGLGREKGGGEGLEHRTGTSTLHFISELHC